MVTNPDGSVAVKYLQTVPHVVKVNQTEYAFVVRFNVCLTWVSPNDLQAILAVKKHCCGGNNNPKYFLANERDVQIWQGN